MSFKSMIRDMKDEFGSISTRGFGSRLRSQSVVDEDSIDDLKLSCWSNMPPELLTEVLMRVEASESTWPSRIDVVSCAGVCRSWRKHMREIVKCPQISGKLTFPISLKQPGPVGSMIECLIKRNRNTQTYTLHLCLTEASNVEDGKVLLVAKRFRRATCTDYVISINAENMSQGSNTYMGKLRSNFLGTKFRVYDAQSPYGATLAPKCHSTRLGGIRRVSPKVPAVNNLVSSISYEVNSLGTRGPRQMRCIMNSIPLTAFNPVVGHKQTDFQLSNTQSKPGSKLALKNKMPRWHPQLHCWCLNFNGRVTVASVKNFQLVAALQNESGAKEHENILLQFGKVGKDLFTMDYRYPISAFEAFAISLSSFDTKIACE